MKMSRWKTMRVLGVTAAVGALIALVSCSGGSSSRLAGISGTGSAVGAITGFGSIFVNGIEFDTSNANVTINKQTGTAGGLRVGMVVSVKGTINGATGVANQVDFNSDIIGPVASLNSTAGTFTVLGQSVAIDSHTVFDNVKLSTLANGDIVEVSGFRDSSGVLHATLVDKQNTAPSQNEVVGTVSQLDSTNKTFNINGLVVDYSAATLDGFGTAGGPANGDLVEAQGTLDTSNANLLHAASVSKEQTQNVQDNQETALQGIAENVASDQSQFQIGSTTILVTANTTFDGGSQSNLANGVRVKVEGTANSSGQVVASHIEISHEANARIEADIQSIDATNKTITVLNNLTVTVTRDTELEDDSSANIDQMRFSDLHVGDHVLIEGSAGAGGQVTATQIKRLNTPQPDRTQVGGVLGSKNTDCSQLVILGVTVDTGSATTFTGSNGATESQSTFCGNVTAGSSIVSASGGAFSGTSFQAGSVSEGSLQKDD